MLDRNIVFWIKEYLEKGSVSEDKEEAIKKVKEFDKPENVISILPALNESTFGRSIQPADKEKFISSCKEDLDAIQNFFSISKVENSLFNDTEWTLDKYFDEIIMDNLSTEKKLMDQEIILKALQIYIEKLENNKINNFYLAKKYIQEFLNKEPKLKKEFPSLFCITFLVNAGNDNSFSKLFLGKKFRKNYTENKDYLKRRAYNILMDLYFLKIKKTMESYGVEIPIELITEDGALSDVSKLVVLDSGIKQIKLNFISIEYNITIDHSLFRELSDLEFFFIADHLWEKNVDIFHDEEGREIRLKINDDGGILAYHDLKEIGKFKKKLNQQNNDVSIITISEPPEIYDKKAILKRAHHLIKNA
jgi:hypothetical protein